MHDAPDRIFKARKVKNEFESDASAPSTPFRRRRVKSRPSNIVFCFFKYSILFSFEPFPLQFRQGF